MASSNINVFRAFAEGREAQGGSVRSVRTESNTFVLYSYGTPIAYRTGHPGDVTSAVGVFDDRSYSVTTSKQRTQAERCFAPNRVVRREHKLFRQQLAELGADLSTAR